MADKTAMVIKKYFGYRQGEGASQFLAELKELSADERTQLAEGIENGSLTY